LEKRKISADDGLKLELFNKEILPIYQKSETIILLEQASLLFAEAA
jgi:hypothetical protein